MSEHNKRQDGEALFAGSAESEEATERGKLESGEIGELATAAAIRSFEPVAREDARVLILGSIPGVQSLIRQQYYGNPRNHFWTLVYGAFGRTPEPDYADRLRFVLDHGIALWDVIAECVRPGSLDSSIRDERIQDFTAFYRRHAHIRTVVFNGTKAYEAYRKLAGLDDGKKYIRLPSSSPTPGRYNKSLEQKQQDWNVIRGYAGIICR